MTPALHLLYIKERISENPMHTLDISGNRGSNLTAFHVFLFYIKERISENPMHTLDISRNRGSNLTAFHGEAEDCDKTLNSFEPGIEPAFIELEGMRNNHCTGQRYTQWDRWFIKCFPTSILREWFPKLFERKYFCGQPMEGEMATFQQSFLLSV
ncbi:hypothetical protein AVEN_84841-1 [Araneus ventricosus]|uniref:Uncharacterized protein n=1 Tax=Araneus ventricosus TaxID=182803 RepID=A0A4Y2CUM6_ARAVE|nr:hypothetical protein AVEN_84841-1 [Araneus ventricosus]